MKAGISSAAEKAAELYRLYEKPMYHIAFAVLKDHHQAEDAVSDSFCRLISHIDKLSEPESPETRQYVIKTVKNAAISRYRKIKREGLSELDEAISDKGGTLSEISSGETRELLDNELCKLSPEDREIVRLRGETGASYKEIAGKLSISEAAARKRFERARKTIITNLKDR